MSARNGDKARAHRERQAAVLRRKKNDELRKTLGLNTKSPAAPIVAAPGAGKRGQA